MPRFTFKPSTEQSPLLEFDALDPSVALEVAGREGFRGGDIWREGEYLCSIRRAGEAAGGGYWIVSQQRSEIRPA